MKGIDYEIIVIDNDSSDDSVEMIKNKFPEIILIANKRNLGLAKAYNQGIKKSKGKYVALLNVDVIFVENSLNETVVFLEKHKNTAGAMCKSVSEDGSRIFQEGFRKEITPFRFFLNDFFYFIFHQLFPNSILVKKLFSFVCLNEDINQEVILFDGCCAVFRKKIFYEFGFFDENLFLYCVEIDFTLRLKDTKWKAYYLGETKLIHLGSKTTSLRKDKQRIYDKDHIYYFRKHYGNFALFEYHIARLPVLLIRFLIFFYEKLTSTINI